MNKLILHNEIQGFINNNINSDIHEIVLKGTAFEDVKTNEIVQQIEGKKRSQKKLPTWFNTEAIYYANKLNIEQTSSEITAKYKSNIIEGNCLIDITGGFGVDTYYFAKKFDSIIHCELNKELSKIVEHNFEKLAVTNVETIYGDGLEYLRQSKTAFDWIYIDPSRRHDCKGKVFLLKDCLPNVPSNLDFLFQHADNILIKTSPLLDLSAGLGELKFVKEIHIVALNNEVKELLWILKNGFLGKVTIKTINISNQKVQKFNFKLKNEKSYKANISEPLTYLFEPNAAILKSGGFNILSEKLNLYKLHAHSHLYTSHMLVEFPGRRFAINQILPYNKKTIQKLKINKANITTRNFPDSVENLRKKFKIKDGGDIYVFFTTLFDNKKAMVITSKIN